MEGYDHTFDSVATEYVENQGFQANSHESSPPTHELELRSPFPARVRGIDSTGASFDEETVLTSLNPQWLQFKLTRLVMPGSYLLVVCKLTTSHDGEMPAPLVAFHGIITGLKMIAGGAWMVEVEYRRHRFLY